MSDIPLLTSLALLFAGGVVVKVLTDVLKWCWSPRPVIMLWSVGSLSLILGVVGQMLLTGPSGQGFLISIGAALLIVGIAIGMSELHECARGRRIQLGTRQLLPPDTIDLDLVPIIQRERKKALLESEE